MGVGHLGGTGDGVSPREGREWPTSWGPREQSLLPVARPEPEGLLWDPNWCHPIIVPNSLLLRHIGVSLSAAGG